MTVVRTPEGRRKSVLRRQEARTLLTNQVHTMPRGELALLEACLRDPTLMRDVEKARWKTKPVPMAQFLEDPYYLGDSCRTLFPALREDMIALFEGGYREVINGGGVGVGKCVDGSTEIYDPIAGRRTTVAGGVRGVVGWDGKQASVCEARAMRSGQKTLGWLTMRSGARVRMSPDHPVLGPWGYVPAASLKTGDLVAGIRQLPIPVCPTEMGDMEVVWVAYMLADGGCTQSSMNFTNADARLHEEFARATLLLGEEDEEGFPPGCSFHCRCGKAWSVRPQGMQWLRRKHKLFESAREKRIPARFYGLSNRQLALFLNRIWACDGWVARRGKRGWEFGISLASEDFVRDIQQLLLRFGIHARIRSRMMSYQYKGERRERPAWSLSILDRDGGLCFLNSIGDIFGKEEACRRARDELTTMRGNTNVDITPMDAKVARRLYEEIGSLSVDGWRPRAKKKQRLGRGSLLRIREAHQLPDWCRWWPDVFWDQVVSYECGSILEDVYDVEVPSAGNWAPSGMIVHNTTAGSLIILRVLYEMSCMANPHAAFGLSDGSELLIPLISKNLVLARRVLKTAVDDKIKLSPYFMNEFTPLFRLEETVFPRNIRLVVGSYGSERVLGANVIAAYLDEGNFPPGTRKQVITQTIGKKVTEAHFDVVEKVYTNLLTRIKSRLMRSGGDTPGLMILTSSAGTINSFLDRRIKEAESDPKVFVRDHTAWTARPREHFSGEMFRVLCGTSSVQSRILAEGEEVDHAQLEKQNSMVVEIPVEYRRDFELNLEDSLRDIAGISTQAISAYIQRVEALEACVRRDREHPWGRERWIAGGEMTFRWDLMVEQVQHRVAGGNVETHWQPLRNPSAPRWIHIDTSLSGDSTGIAMTHIAKWVEVHRRSLDGRPTVELAPYYVVDFMLRIDPPSGEQIFLGDVRQLVYELQEHGYYIMGLTTDQFQSADTRQQVKRIAGIPTDLQSMDITTQPYDVLKGAIYEGRLEMYDYAPVLEELRALEYDRERGKVDHPRAKSKDIADALAGSVFGLFKNSALIPITQRDALDVEKPPTEQQVMERLIGEGMVRGPVDADEIRTRQEASRREFPVPFLSAD